MYLLENAGTEASMAGRSGLRSKPPQRAFISAALAESYLILASPRGSSSGVSALRVRGVTIQPGRAQEGRDWRGSHRKETAMQHIIALETRSTSELNYMMRDAHERLYAARTGSPEHNLARAAIDMISRSLMQRLG